MYIIDASGALVYKGGIDSIPSSNVADVPKATQYVRVALDQVLAGKPVDRGLDPPYGCTLKYGNNAAKGDRAIAARRLASARSSARHPHITTTAPSEAPDGAARSDLPAVRRRQCADGRRAAQRIADAANRFLAGLDDAQRKQAMIAFESGNRLDWHYIPRSRQGLTLGEMKPAQRDAAQALFASVLNERGLQAIENVRIVEGVLREQQGIVPRSRPLLRLDLRHARPLPVGLAARGPSPVAERRAARRGPYQRGRRSSSARIPRRCATGPHKGLRPLGAAEDLARAAHGVAHRRAAAHRDHRRALVRRDRRQPGRERDLAQPAGLALSAMDGTARNLVEALIDRFVGTLAPDLAAAQKQRVIEQELGRFRFAWAGRWRRPGALLPRARTGDADRARQHAEQRQPRPLGVARPQCRFRQRRAGGPLSPRTTPVGSNRSRHALPDREVPARS
jgi:hypothetical protein